MSPECVELGHNAAHRPDIDRGGVEGAATQHCQYSTHDKWLAVAVNKLSRSFHNHGEGAPTRVLGPSPG